MAEPTYGVVTAGATYRALSDLLGRTADARGIMEGNLQARTNSFEIITGPATAPEATQEGTEVDQGDDVSFGPVLHKDTAWPLTRVWVKRAGTEDATAVFNGVVA